MLTPAERRNLAALQARLAALERRVMSVAGTGVSNRAGPVQVRTTQLGFEAELTSKFDAGSGAGYAWKRLKLVSGADPPFTDPGVQLTGDKAYSFVGDEDLKPGAIGWLEPSPDADGYVFVHGDDAARPPAVGGGCSTDVWLKYGVGGGCWTFVSGGGIGDSALFPADETGSGSGSGGLGGVTAVYNFDELGWVGVSGGPERGALLRTCCGCGVGILRINPDAPTGSRATFELRGVHTSCAEGSGSGGSGSGAVGEVFSVTLTDYCSTPGFIAFFGRDPRVCDGDPGPCGNYFRILAYCGAECPTSVCECDGCFDCLQMKATRSFYNLAVTGFSSEALNGAWVWEWVEGCQWVAECDGVTSVFEYIEGSFKWRLTHGGGVYEINKGDWNCCVGGSLSKVGGDGPELITLEALSCDVNDDCDFDFPDLIAEVEIEGCGTVTFHLTYLDVDPGGYESEGVALGACCPDTPIELWNASMSCGDGTWGFGMGAPTGTALFPGVIDVTSLVPFSGTQTGEVTCNDGGVPITRNTTVTITEAP